MIDVTVQVSVSANDAASWLSEHTAGLSARLRTGGHIELGPHELHHGIYYFRLRYSQRLFSPPTEPPNYAVALRVLKSVNDETSVWRIRLPDLPLKPLDLAPEPNRDVREALLDLMRGVIAAAGGLWPAEAPPNEPTLQSPPSTGGTTLPSTLKTREQEIIRWWTGGQTGAEIAATLGVSPKTVQNRISELRKRLGAKVVPHHRSKA